MSLVLFIITIIIIKHKNHNRLSSYFIMAFSRHRTKKNEGQLFWLFCMQFGPTKPKMANFVFWQLKKKRKKRERDRYV